MLGGHHQRLLLQGRAWTTSRSQIARPWSRGAEGWCYLDVAEGERSTLENAGRAPWRTAVVAKLDGRQVTLPWS
jgi:hypothetical protein